MMMPLPLHRFWGSDLASSAASLFHSFWGISAEDLALSYSLTSSTAFLKDDCSDEAINYKADLTVYSGLNKFASLTFPV